MSESPIEALFRVAASALWPDTPRLVQEHPVQAGGRSYRLDFAVPGLKRAVELDGHATHSSPEDIARDRQRKRALEDAGWQVRYYGGQEVTQDADRVVRDALKWCGLEAKAQAAHCGTCSCYTHVAAEYERPGEAEAIAEYEEGLRICRHLCLHALLRARTRRPSHLGPGVLQAYEQEIAGHNGQWPLFPPRPGALDWMDEQGYWDLYDYKYDYTRCLSEQVLTQAGWRLKVIASCGHHMVQEGCHCTAGSFCPNSCGHSWYQCTNCSVRFPVIGHEAGWLACSSCA